MKIIQFPDFVRRYFSGEEFVVFDTETTGLNTFHDNIIEIGATIWGRDGKINDYEELIKIPENKFSKEAERIHGIPYSKLADAPEPKDVYDNFLKFCGDRALVAHNIKFDFPMLNSNLIRNGFTPYQNDQVACSLVYAKEQKLPGKLKDLADHYEVIKNNANLHRALYDVEILIEVLEKMMQENEPEDMQYSLII